MKKKGAKCDYIEGRNANVRREFMKRLGKDGRQISEIFEEISREATADRFYISEERILRLLKHPEELTDKTLRTRKEMVEEIRRRVDALMKAFPAMKLPEAVYRVVNSPAPAFYLTPGSIRTIIYRQRS